MRLCSFSKADLFGGFGYSICQPETIANLGTLEYHWRIGEIWPTQVSYPRHQRELRRYNTHISCKFESNPKSVRLLSGQETAQGSPRSIPRSPYRTQRISGIGKSALAASQFDIPANVRRTR